MQKNKIELMNMTGAKMLVYLDASHNQLMNIHGLGGCSSLRHLDLSHNRITRVGKSCRGWLVAAAVCHVRVEDVFDVMVDCIIQFILLIFYCQCYESISCLISVLDILTMVYEGRSKSSEPNQCTEEIDL